MSLYYFAFGSNMDKQQMEDRKKEFEEKHKGIMKVEFTDGQKGIMKDWKLIFNKINSRKEGAGFANIEPKKDSVVEGIIYKVNDDTIKMLDWYEGVRFDSYRRETMLVESERNESKNCIVYIANPTKTNNSLKPEKWYLNRLLKGKEYLSDEYFSDLKKIEKALREALEF